MLAELELTMVCGASWSLDADEDEMRKLVISLTKKMNRGVREVVRVAGRTYHNGVLHSVELHVRTDELVGVKLRTPRSKTDARSDGCKTA